MSASANSALRVVAIDDDEQHLKFIATALSRENVRVMYQRGKPVSRIMLVNTWKRRFNPPK